ncbi:MAG: tryptophan-rich sensory protein [Sphingomonas sp.]|nr:tryptophan-rich sensory protein [Sphingomonas sp.]
MPRLWLFPIVVGGLVAAIVAIMGLTIALPDAWYHQLVLPRWAPRDDVFGLVWMIVYGLTAIAVITGWRAMPTREGDWLIGLFAISGFLNILWSMLFYRLHRPDWSQVEVILFWISALALVVHSWRWSITAALMFLPYLGWVTFTGYLNLVIVRLNGPFG